MTCIVGIVEDGVVHIGGDSAAVSGDRINARAHGKVFRVGEFLIGTSGSGRQHQLLRYSWKPPRQQRGQDVMEFMVNDVMDSLRAHLKSKGALGKDSEVEHSNGAFLIGYRGHLFTAYQDFQVADSLYPFRAVGSGELYALGALNATVGQPPEARLLAALTAAAEFAGSVRPPFTFDSIDSSVVVPDEDPVPTATGGWNLFGWVGRLLRRDSTGVAAG